MPKFKCIDCKDTGATLMYDPYLQDAVIEPCPCKKDESMNLVNDIDTLLAQLAKAIDFTRVPQLAYQAQFKLIQLRSSLVKRR